MKPYRVLSISLLLLLAGICCDAVPAQDLICIKAYLHSTDARALGFLPSDVERLVTQEANAIGLSPKGINVVPCEMASKVRSSYIDGSEVPKGEYILYDPIWVREVLGPDIGAAGSKRAHDEAIFLFGHELGHLLGRHFTANEQLTRLDKEIEADRFAGCAAGALGADWPNISAFISKIRDNEESSYPSRSHSLQIAKTQFDTCHGRGTVAIPKYTPNGPGPVFGPPKMNGRMLDGCLLSPEHPNGDDCSAHGITTVAAQFCKVAGYSGAVEEVRTTMLNTVQSSYKLTEKLTADGYKDYVWNEDNGGGFEIATLRCVKVEEPPATVQITVNNTRLNRWIDNRALNHPKFCGTITFSIDQEVGDDHETCTNDEMNWHYDVAVGRHRFMYKVDIDTGNGNITDACSGYFEVSQTTEFNPYIKFAKQDRLQTCLLIPPTQPLPR